MKRICLFAGYDKTNIIQDYVVYYLKELSSVSDVYYMADNEISESEKLKIIPYVKGAYGFHHKKYDFGSWQELINIIGWDKISEYDELILANDSVFGPLYSMKDFFNKIEDDKEWDVCGITEECSVGKNQTQYIIENFLQSYFIVLKKYVFAQNFFKQFFKDYKRYERKEDVVLNGEKRLSRLLLDNKIVIKKVVRNLYDPFKEWKSVVNAGSPFIKKSKFINKKYSQKYEMLYKYTNFIQKHTAYNSELIDRYLTANNINISYFYSIQYCIITVYENIKYIRKKLFTINLKPYKKVVKIFGINIIKNIYKQSGFQTIK